MRIGRLIDPRFQDIVRKMQQVHIPMRAAYKLKAIVKTIDEEIAKYEDLRKDALEKHGKRTEAGDLEKDESGNVQFTDEVREVFMKEIGDLLAMDVPVAKLSVKELGENINLSVEDLFFVEDLIED